jgi:hypothetical protein
MTAMLSHQQFAARLGQACTLRRLAEPDDVSAPIAAVLHQVDERQVRSGYEQFAVLFRREDAHAPQQALYEVGFPDAEPMALLLVPVGREGQAILYEACFNRDCLADQPS